MRVHRIVSTAVVFAATAASAQTPAPQTDSGCITSGNGRVECRKVVIGSPYDRMFRLDHSQVDSAMMKRAILGIELRPTGTRRDTLGVFVEAVTPKGPAEMAGIVEGDRIAAINGVDLRVAAADVDDPYTNGLGAHRLSREVQKLTPGSRITLRVYADGRFRDVLVTAGRASDFMHDGGFRINIGGPDGMSIDPEHLKMIFERTMGGDGGQMMRMRAPSGATPMLMPMPAMPMPAMPMRHPMFIRV